MRFKPGFRERIRYSMPFHQFEWLPVYGWLLSNANIDDWDFERNGLFVNMLYVADEELAVTIRLMFGDKVYKGVIHTHEATND